MNYFTPPYPERHKTNPSAFKAILQARQDLLSIWTEDAFKFEFMSQQILKQKIFIVNDPKLVKEVLVTKHHIYEKKSPQMIRALEPLLGDGLFISDGGTWASHRHIQTPLFHTGFVQNYSKIMVSTITEIADDWANQKSTTVDVLPEMGRLTAEIISRTLFGENLGKEKAAKVVKAFADYQSSIKQTPLSSFTDLPNWTDKLSIKSHIAMRAAKRIHAVVDEIIDKAGEKENQDTLVAHLLAANDGRDTENSLNREQIRNEIIVLFMAGHETTANSLAWCWYLLSQSPDVEAKLHAELDEVLEGRLPSFSDVAKLPYTRAIFDESIRLYPPVPILSRQASEDDTIRRQQVPKGSLMLVVPWLLHRHENLWDQPNTFIPERFLAGAENKPNKFAYLPFSAGPRVCLGKSFGIVESVLSIAILAQRFRLKLPEGAKVSHECRLTLRPKGSLPMTLEKRIKDDA